MPRIPSWRVRVKRAIEDWVDVEAESAVEAEQKAIAVPGVLSVFGKSAVRSDFVAESERPAGVRED